MYIDLIFNLTLLVALTVVSGFIEKRTSQKQRRGPLLQGLLFGAAAIIAMLRPLDFGNGVFFDGRSVMISLCALYFGPRAAAVAVAMAVLCRAGLGGSGMVTGILTILSSAGVGLAARLSFSPQLQPPSAGFLYLFGIVSHLVMLPLMLTLPGGVGLRIMMQIGPPVMLLFPLATILAGKILTDQILATHSMDALRESEERLQSIISGTGAGTWEWNIQTGETIFNERWAEMVGYTLAELEPVSITTWQQLVHPDDLKKSEELLERHFNGQLDKYRFEGRMRHKNGDWIWVVDLGQVFEWTEDGRPLRMAGTHLDITERKHREKVLREHQDAYLSMLAAAHDGFWVVDRNGYLLDVNETYVRQSGYRREELLNMRISDIEARESLQETAARIEKVVSDGSDLFEAVHRRRDGSTWIVEVSCTYCPSQEGRFYAFIRDITDRKATEHALRESEQRNRALLSALPDMIFLLDGKGVFLDCHAPASIPLLMPRDRFIGCPVDEILPDEIAEKTHSSIAEAQRSGEAGAFSYHLEIEGQTRFFESRVVACSDNRFLSVVRDITQREQAEVALREKNTELERFVYTVSHDLRSPLVTITSFLALLQEDIAEGDTQAIETDISYMKTSAGKMEKLLGELLQLSRTGHTATQRVDVGFQQTVNESVAAVKGALMSRGVSVDIADEQITLWGDPLNFSQIWQNLIGNAVKYMGNQTEPRIEIGIEHANGETVFFVHDNGMGIDPCHKEKVFGLFEKLDGESEGSGLGLALVKRIVESYQGRIWVESQGVGTGSCFKFILPQALKIEEQEKT